MTLAPNGAPRSIQSTQQTRLSVARFLWFLPRNAAIAVMLLYRMAISPLYGNVCRYHPSCSSYSLQAYQQRGLLLGLALTLYRLVRCNPFTPGGIDDVPRSRTHTYTLNTHGFVIEAQRKA